TRGAARHLHQADGRRGRAAPRVHPGERARGQRRRVRGLLIPRAAAERQASRPGRRHLPDFYVRGFCAFMFDRRLGKRRARRAPTSMPRRIAMDISRFLITLGVAILVVGLLWPVLGKIGLGRLPGDIVIRRDNFTFYFPIVTCLLISAVLSLILWLVNR